MSNNSFHPCVSVPLRSKASDNSGRGGTVRGKLNPAPAFGFNTESRRDSPSTPGRMENIRILIEEAKAATEEGRFSEAIRKYETALVTMPEGYKPRVRNKIARLEARLEVSKEQKIGMGSPSTRLSRGLHGDLGGSGDVPGPLDLLHIAVKDVTGSERVACSSAASATLSSRRPSSIPWEPYPITGGAREERHESERGDDQEHEDQDRENVWDGKVNLVSDDDDTAQSKNCSQQDRRPLSNKALSDTLEKQIIDKMNKASYEELVSLHEIGFRRAQMILKTRAVTPFEVLSDLSRIGMFPKQIEKMGKHNMLECLDVGPRSADRPRVGGPSDSVDLQEHTLDMRGIGTL